MHGSDKSVLRGRFNKFVMAWTVYCYEMIGGAALKMFFRVMFECVSYNVLCVLAASHGVWISSQGQWHVQS